MQRHIRIAMVGLLASLSLGAGSALANTGVQSVDQQATSAQSAAAAALSEQQHPTNENVGVRIDSPGSDGDVTQSNSSAAAAAAGNLNATDQSATQDQAGGSGGVQSTQQDATSTQDASATATSSQYHPSNTNVSVRIHSPGDGGSVEQSNSSAAVAKDGNLNATKQSAEQEQAGGTGGVQSVTQDATSTQDADAAASSSQYHPSNTNVSVRIGSPGDDGSVEQSNSSAAVAKAGNLNATKQWAEQEQAGEDPCRKPLSDGCSSHKSAPCCDTSAGVGVQAIGQKAASDQNAEAEATSEQYHPSNTNAPVRIASPGGGGSVEQSNDSAALAAAGNLNATKQWADQDQPAPGGACCAGGVGVQAIGQHATSEQDADATATSIQKGASNLNAPVRIASPGDDGSVEQSNVSLAAALAGNANLLLQQAMQTQGGAV
jgi:hypothetical protein